MEFLLLCLLTLIPVLYALSVSFSGKGAALSGNLSFFPKNPTIENYKAILLDEPFLLWMKNSLLLSAGTIFAAMICAVPAAYATSRWRFHGRRMLLQTLLVLNAFPQVLSLFALFRVLKTMGLLNRHAGLILIYAGSMCVFAVWNMKGYFDTIPVEIEEASKIDVACYYRHLHDGFDYRVERIPVFYNIPAGQSHLFSGRGALSAAIQ